MSLRNRSLLAVAALTAAFPLSQSSAQLGFAESMGYNGTISGLKLPEPLEKRIGFTEAETKTMLKQDYDYLAKNDAGLKEWWDKVFKA